MVWPAARGDGCPIRRRRVQGRSESCGGRMRQQRLDLGANLEIVAMGGDQTLPTGLRNGAPFFEEAVQQCHLLLGHLRDYGAAGISGV